MKEVQVGRSRVVLRKDVAGYSTRDGSKFSSRDNNVVAPIVSGGQKADMKIVDVAREWLGNSRKWPSQLLLASLTGTTWFSILEVWAGSKTAQCSFFLGYYKYLFLHHVI